MLRRTNYGLLVDDDGKPNKNELAIDFIVESARSVGIEVIEGKTALDIQFMAEVMKKLREKQEPKTEVLDKIRAEIDEQYDRVYPYNISCAEGLEMALEIINKYTESEDKE